MGKLIDVEGNWFTGYRVDIRDAFVALEARDIRTLLNAVPAAKLSEALAEVDYNAELKTGHNCVSGWHDFIADDYDGRVEGYPYTDFEDMPIEEHAELVEAFKKVSNYLSEML